MIDWLIVKIHRRVRNILVWIERTSHTARIWLDTKRLEIAMSALKELRTGKQKGNDGIRDR